MMKLLFTMLILTAVEPGFAQNSDMETLKQLNVNWISSYPKKDSTTLSRILADDFILVTTNGVKMTKADIINNLYKQETLSARVDSAEVRLLTSEVGLITAYASFVLRAEGKEMAARTCYQDTYIKRNNRWVAVAAHVTVLSSK